MATDTQVIKVGNGSQLWRDLKSHQGAKGDKGDTGAKGEPFTYDDFTPSQLAALKGEKGDQGPQGEKGETGKAFTYEDLTPEQRLAIRGDEIDTSGFASKADLEGKANKTHTHAQADITGLQTALNGKANTSHTHSISNVSNLQSNLDRKAEKVHTHAIGDVTGLQSQLDSKANKTDLANVNVDLSAYATKAEVDNKVNYVKVDSDGHVKYIKSQADFRPDGPWKPVADSKAVALKDHKHGINDINGLQSELDRLSQADGLDEVTKKKIDDSLTTFRINQNGKPQYSRDNGDTWTHYSGTEDVALKSHSHSISDVTGLESELDLRPTQVRVKDDGEVQWLRGNSWWRNSDHNKVALKDHTHSIVDVTNLQNELDKKSHVNHKHTVFDINGLQNQLDNIGKIKDYQSGQWLSAYVVSSGRVPSDTSGKIIFERE